MGYSTWKERARTPTSAGSGPLPENRQEIFLATKVLVSHPVCPGERGWVGGWVGGWFGWIEEDEAVRMSYCTIGEGGWVGGWVGDVLYVRERWVGGWER